MKLVVLCLCALLCAVTCRSVQEDYVSLTELSSEPKSRPKRQILGSCGCPIGKIKFLGTCIPCELYVEITGEQCPSQC